MQIDNESFAAMAAGLDPGLSGASLHGALAGGLCADAALVLDGSMLGAALDLVLDNADLEPSGVHEALAVIEEALRDPELGFQPLLPEDESSLEQRAHALAQWCDAFVGGFSATNRGDPGSLSAETSEILADLASIAGGLEGQALAGGSDEDEGDFMQIAEFVRIAALSIFAERALPPGDKTLH